MMPPFRPVAAACASLATVVCAPVAAAALGGEAERVQVADHTFRRARPSAAASVLGEGAPA